MASKVKWTLEYAKSWTFINRPELSIIDMYTEKQGKQVIKYFKIQYLEFNISGKMNLSNLIKFKHLKEYRVLKFNENIWNLESIISWTKINRSDYNILKVENRKENNKTRVYILVKHKNYDITDWIMFDSFYKGIIPKKIYNTQNNLKDWTFENIQHHINIKYKEAKLLEVKTEKGIKKVLIDYKDGFSLKWQNQNDIINFKLPRKYTLNNDINFNIKNWLKNNKPYIELHYDVKDINDYNICWKYIGENWDYSEEERYFKCSFKSIKSRINYHPILNSYKMENIAEEFLKENNIKYKPQYTFKDCKHKRVLPFDFAILNEDNSVKVLLELHGEQHYKFNNYFFKNEEDFLLRQKLDKLKEEYCKNKNIQLLIIPYSDINNIKSILNKELKII